MNWDGLLFISMSILQFTKLLESNGFTGKHCFLFHVVIAVETDVHPDLLAIKLT